MIKNKRFWIGTGSFVVWLVAVLFFKQDCVRFATGITLIVTPYIAGETFRPSGTKTTVTDNPPVITTIKSE
jgi:hypothetical protein